MRSFDRVLNQFRLGSVKCLPIDDGPLIVLVNDSYCTELSLIFPPYIIALAAIYIASATCEIDLRLWFSEICVDMKEIWMASNELLEFYESVKREKASPPIPTASLLSRLPSRISSLSSNQMAPSHPPNFVPSKQTGRSY
eukprot:TRINITY_DN2452_c0_g1_i7.p1 TRINITY_DN2452_c0_g1~~TRINITY_DN2452_c0_g1_i7.p1  ORF type:complete len:140 (-),score=3.52 TRINITY_DN2452_c0_g1_i7:139-558(-)